MDLENHRDICKRFGYSSLSYMTLNPNLEHYTKKGIDGYIAYRKHGRTVVALTDPMCSTDDVEALTGAFRKRCGKRGEHLVFFAVTERFKKQFMDMGYRNYIVARDSVLEVAGFSLKGNRMMNVRRGYNRARNSNLTFEELKTGPLQDLEVFEEFRSISKEWLKLKETPELDNLLWKLDPAPNPDLRYFYSRSKDRLEGFVAFNPIYATGDWYLDLSRRWKDSTNGVLDFLIVESLNVLRAEGMKKLYLGMVPNVEVTRQFYQDSRVGKRFMAFAAREANTIYPVDGEHFFKNKFGPDWHDLFIFSDTEIRLRHLYDMFRFVQPRGMFGILRHKVASKFA